MPGDRPTTMALRAAVGYVRVSTDGQTDGYSLEHQHAVIAGWCERTGVELLGICGGTTGGESGRDLDRIGLQEAAALLDRHPQRIRYLVVSKIDRLTRRLTDGAYLQEILGNREIRIIAPEDGLAALDGATTFQVSFLAWLGEMERRRILARVHPGQLARLRAGLPIHRLPLGYRLEPVEAPTDGSTHGTGERVAIDPASADLVRGLFGLAATTDLGLRRLADWCNEHAIAHQHELDFSPQRVRLMLSNRFYIGTMTVTFSHPGGDERFEKLDNHPALIDRATFQLVQDGLAGRRHLHVLGINDSKATSLLGGIARCHRCQAPVTPNKTGPAPADRVYCCSNRFSGRCDAPAAPAPLCDAQIQLALQDRLSALTADLVEHLQHAIDTLPQLLDRQRTEAEARLRAGQEHLDLLDRSVEEGTITPEEHAVSCTRERAAIATAQAALSETDGWTYVSRLAATEAEPGRWRFLPWDVVLHRLELADRRRLIRAAFTHVDVSDAGLGATIGSLADRKTFIATLAKGYAGTLAEFPGIDVDAQLQKCGWKRFDGTDGPYWKDEHGNSISWRVIASRGRLASSPLSR